MAPESFTVAIDGPVAAGKTSVGKRTAELLGTRFLDTGQMYRAVAWAALRREVAFDDEVALTKLVEALPIELSMSQEREYLLVDGIDTTARLNSQHVARGASLIARIADVRRILVRQQRSIASEGPIVMVGRDIGTVVITDATVKVYLTASLEARAKRRHLELEDTPEPIDYDQVMVDLMRRDKMDTERALSPLRPAQDATCVDTTSLSVDELAQKITRMAISVGWKSSTH